MGKAIFSPSDHIKSANIAPKPTNIDPAFPAIAPATAADEEVLAGALSVVLDGDGVDVAGPADKPVVDGGFGDPGVRRDVGTLMVMVGLMMECGLLPVLATWMV